MMGKCVGSFDVSISRQLYLEWCSVWLTCCSDVVKSSLFLGCFGWTPL
jgi:hypothetical protein